MDIDEIYVKRLIECDINNTYDEKAKILKENIRILINNSSFIEKFDTIDLDRIIDLLKNENLLVAGLPIVRYNNKVFCFSKTLVDDYEHGKYDLLTVDEIEKYLNDNYLVFIYTLSDTKSDNIRYRVIIKNKL